MRELIEIAHHRNGICGEPFYVVRFDDTEGGRMVATVFAGVGQVAVLNMDRTAEGNIAFAQGNSWRGDHYEGWLRERIAEDKVRRQAEWDALDAEAAEAAEPVFDFDELADL